MTDDRDKKMLLRRAEEAREIIQELIATLDFENRDHLLLGVRAKDWIEKDEALDSMRSRLDRTT